MSVDQHWERNAQAWTAWAREPGHDAFWAYLAAFRDFLPPAGRATLELGCGEGRVSRALTALGHRVTASDVSATLLAAAERSGSAERYRLADVAALPFADGEFDHVVAYNMLMDVPDMPKAVAEAARVLEPGGVLSMSVVHPFTDRGRFDENGVFTVVDDYFATSEFLGEENRNGLTMKFHGWSHPLQAYTSALADAGLVIADLREPVPAEALSGDQQGLERWRRIPLFLWINAERSD